MKIKESRISKNSVTNSDAILIQGARMHNLKNISVQIPRNQLTVVTGVSGSGKSSLTMDTLYAEGQRRYAESLSAYARQFMARMHKPDVDFIKGLCPAIAIEQKVITRTPRSTVGSMTELYDYLRLLFARIGKIISPISGRQIKKDDVHDVLKFIQSLSPNTKILIIVSFKTLKNRSLTEELNILLQKGFSRLAFKKSNTLSGLEIVRIEDVIESQPKEIFSTKNELYVLIDRWINKTMDEDDEHRLADSIGTAFFEGEGDMMIETDGNKFYHFSHKLQEDGIQFEEPTPNLFSYNNPFGACPTCEGFAQVLGIDPKLVIPNTKLSVFQGAVAPWKGEKLQWWLQQFLKASLHNGFPVHRPIYQLSKDEYDFLWNGDGEALGINDFFEEVERNLYKVQYRVLQSRYRGKTLCPDCKGYRLRKEALYVKVHNKHIGELSTIPIKDLKKWFDDLELNEYDTAVAKRLLIEIHQRLKTMLDVGLGYLTLNRLANTLSGGESQRIQLTRNLGSNLTNSLYILDEPSIGLHPRDTEQLINVLKQLRDLNNTVVVVEHDEMMMRQADHIIDMGPLASHLGGEVVAQGNYEEIVKNEKSLTGKYLKSELKIEPPAKVRKWNQFLKISGARQHNLKNIDVTIPLNVLCVVSGVSGSGKTTLVKHILYPAMMEKITGNSNNAGLHDALEGDVQSIQSIEMIDQNPIGKSSRSNPVTYIKAYDEIRDLFSKQPLSKIRVYQPKHFSFNVDGGRCDTCKGEGEQVVEMQFLADVHLVCESCNGKRFKEEVLEVLYKEKSIYDVLEMSVDDAILFFKDEKIIADKLKPLADVGLGYIKLGQSSDTLSGGEAQRIKLASFLGKGSGIGKMLFIFDEPTTGLHFHDVKKLLASLNALIEQGHSVLVIEHNTDVIKSADWLIDLGPEAGDGGGNLVFAGIPADIKKVKESFTGRYL